MKRRDTTLEQVEDVRARLRAGETSAAIAKVTGLAPTTISRIKDGWKPSGRKPIKLFPSVARQRGER